MKFINQFLLQASHGCVRSLFHFPSLSRRLASMLWHVPESIYLMCIERTRYQNNCVRKCKNERNKIYLDIYNIVMILSHTHTHTCTHWIMVSWLDVVIDVARFPFSMLFALYVRFEASEHQEWLQFLLPILICVYVNRPNIDSSHRIWSIRRLLKRLMCVFRLIYIFNVKTYTTNPWKNCQTMKNRFR